MRTLLLAFVAMTAGLLTAPAEASAGRATAAEPNALYTCATNGLSRVALNAVALNPGPAPCCTGSFGCPQLLSNTGLLKLKRANHT